MRVSGRRVSLAAPLGRAGGCWAHSERRVLPPANRPGAAQRRCSHQHSLVGAPAASGQTLVAQRLPACPSSGARTLAGRRIANRPALHAPWPQRVFASKPPPPLQIARPLPHPPRRACTGELPPVPGMYPAFFGWPQRRPRGRRRSTIARYRRDQVSTAFCQNTIFQGDLCCCRCKEAWVAEVLLMRPQSLFLFNRGRTSGTAMRLHTVHCHRLVAKHADKLCFSATAATSGSSSSLPGWSTSSSSAACPRWALNGRLCWQRIFNMILNLLNEGFPAFSSRLRKQTACGQTSGHVSWGTCNNCSRRCCHGEQTHHVGKNASPVISELTMRARLPISALQIR